MHEAVQRLETPSFDFEPLSREIVDCAFQIHQTIGAGLLEGVYEDCFEIELKKRNIAFERQKIIKVEYAGVFIPTTYRLDLVVEGRIIVELKSVEKIIRAHQAQILTYMKTSDIKIGLIINFGDPYFKSGVKRFVL